MNKATTGLGATGGGGSVQCCSRGNRSGSGEAEGVRLPNGIELKKKISRQLTKESHES
jgi:hypothetical protein